MTTSERRIGKVTDIEPGCIMRVEVDGHGYCIAHLAEGGFHAIDDLCTHEEQSLSDGELWNRTVECPAHGSRFDVITGEVTGLPANTPTKAYAVRVDGDFLVLDA